MRQYYQKFVWKYSEKTKIELNPGAEAFIISPERKEFVSIKESDTVSYLAVLYIPTYLHTEFSLFRFVRRLCTIDKTVRTLISTLLGFFLKQKHKILPAAQ